MMFSRKTDNVDDVMAQDVNELQESIETGWIPVSDTWTRVSDHVFAVKSDVTASYSPGVKVRYKDGGSYKYGVIGSSVHLVGTTTVTLISTSDYTMAATVITDMGLGIANRPKGWPDWFNWTPTLTGFSADPTGLYRWRADGRRIEIAIRHNADGTSNANTFVVTAPFAARTLANMIWRGRTTFVDNSTTSSTPGSLLINQASANLVAYTNSNVGAWTNVNNKRIVFGSIFYEI